MFLKKIEIKKIHLRGHGGTYKSTTCTNHKNHGMFYLFIHILLNLKSVNFSETYRKCNNIQVPNFKVLSQ